MGPSQLPGTVWHALLHYLQAFQHHLLSNKLPINPPYEVIELEVESTFSRFQNLDGTHCITPNLNYRIKECGILLTEENVLSQICNESSSEGFVRCVSGLIDGHVCTFINSIIGSEKFGFFCLFVFKLDFYNPTLLQSKLHELKI